MSVIHLNRKKQVYIGCKTVDKLYKDNQVKIVSFLGGFRKKYKALFDFKSQINLLLLIIKFSTLLTHFTNSNSA